MQTPVRDKRELANLCSQGEFRSALALAETLCTANPRDPELWYMRGAIHGSLNEFADAERCCREALKLAPDQPVLHCNLGTALLHLGRNAEAADAFRAALQRQPALPQALTGLADSLLRLQQPDEAIPVYERSLAAAPGQPNARHNLAQAYRQSGRASEATRCYELAFRMTPASSSTALEWAQMEIEQGKLGRAEAILLEAVKHQPNVAELWYRLGFVRHELGRYEEATGDFNRCISLSSDHDAARFARSMILRHAGRIEEAATDLEILLRKNEANSDAHAGIAGILKDQGRVEEMRVHHARALALDPSSPGKHSNLLLGLHYVPGIDVQTLINAHREWGALHGHVDQMRTRHVNEPIPARTLRIGYVSADFNSHSVGHFTEPVIRSHDRNHCTIFCYSNLQPERADETTKRIRASTDVWRDIASMSDADVATLIAADGIDILVDLGGHTAGNRLGVFAHKPAPLQVTWLGYPDTTGLPAMDYRLTDRWADPEGESDGLNTERLLRVPGGFLCYGPPSNAPDVGPLPYDGSGTITFGSFNNFAKVNDTVIGVWSQLLKNVPASRLILKSIALRDTGVRERVRQKFATQGVDPDRIELLAWTSAAEAHLAIYGRVDIALDTFPYNGTTTTCEALWMGVPVVTLYGNTHAGRVGASLLNQVGLAELITADTDQYVTRASALATDPGALRALHVSLRERMRVAPLTDAKGFCARLETIYRSIWQQWCASRSVSVPPQDTLS
jgi:predicted O-linked N-acetylglucosamine transferase (SPINDLY family)